MERLITGISAKFGYYPQPYSIETERFSVETLPDHKSITASVSGDPDIVDGWIYPGAQQHLDFMSGNIHSMPYSSRVFGLPKTHNLKLHVSESRDDLDFVVWCLSFFTGMRLTTTEAGYLDATPLRDGTLVDFLLSGCTLTDVIELALDYVESERGNPLAVKRVAAVINALFLAQYPQSLSFERFQYLYMALDACFKLVKDKKLSKSLPTHAGRIQWMCEQFVMDVPEWARSIEKLSSPLSVVRNDTFHEALFFDEPLGFSIYGGNSTVPQSNVILEMQALICRLLVAILGKPKVSYVLSAIDTRQVHGLALRN